MSRAQVLLTAALLLATVLITAGVWMLFPPAALITAGVLLAGVTLIVASEVSE